MLQIALLKLKKNLNSIQGLTQRVLKPYMNSGASITYLGLSNDRNDGLDEEDKEVCKNTVNVFLKESKDKVQPNAPSLCLFSGLSGGARFSSSIFCKAIFAKFILLHNSSLWFSG